MRAKFLRLLILSSFVLVGCNNPFNKKNETEPETEENQGGEQGGEQGGGEQITPDSYLRKPVNFKMETLLKGGTTPYSIEVNYDDTLFVKDAEVYNKDLSLLSFGAAVSATYENWAKDFLTDCEFKNPLLHEMDIEPTENTLGYTLGHKTIDSSELFAVMIRGHEYKREWVNNFIIGETGDHEGWLARTSELYASLTTYVNQYKGDNRVKLWIVGYSRAGAISNMLASLLFRGNEISIVARDMFVYTFEAPGGLTEEHATKYANVHNIVNSADIVTYIPPTQYGLYRAGQDEEIYDANVSAIVHAWDNQVTIPAFVSTQGTTNDLQFVQYVLSSIFNYDGDASKTAKTREQYVANYQTGLSYSIGLMFAMNPSTRQQMLNALTSDYMTALTVLGDSSGQSMANFLKTYLDMDHISYNNSELVSACAVLVKATGSIFSGILGLYMSDAGKTDMQRMFNMHYPEVTYCLLNNMHSKLA